MKSEVKFSKIKIDEVGCHLLVKVKLNNKWFTLVIDTGASQTVLDYHIAREISRNQARHLENASSTGVGGEPLQSHLLQIEKFKIGDITILDNYFILLDLQHVNSQYEKIGKWRVQGVLGGDILNGYQAVIDYKKSRMVLTYKKKGGNASRTSRSGG